MNVPILAAILACVTLFLILFGLSSSLSSRSERLVWRKRADGTGENTTEAEEVAPQKKSLVKFFGTLGEAAKTKDKDKDKDEAGSSHLRKTLAKAGYRSPQGPIVMYGAKLFGAALLPALFALVWISALTNLESMHTIGLFVATGLVGYFLPNLWVSMKISQRKQKISDGFPDALDLMVVCVEAGLGLDAAINKIGEDLQMSNKPLSEEFQLLGLGMRAGQSRQEALRGLATRTDLEDVHNLVTLLIQTDRFGTSIAQTLRVHSDTMRTKRHQRAEEMAAKLPVKLLFPLIFFIFPSLFVAILGPAVIQIARVLLPTMAAG